MKRCCRCGSSKPPESFYRNNQSPDGRAPLCAECARAEKRVAYAAEPAKYKARVAAYRRANPGKAAAVSEAWRRRNWERFKAGKKAWRKKNPAKLRALYREYARRRRARYPRRIADYRLAYRAKNRDRINEQRRGERARLTSRKASALRRARKRAAAVGSVDFKAIYARDGGRCWICWRTIPLALTHFDHLIPLARGGEHSENNIRVACQSCNDRKSDRMPTPALIAEIHERVLGIAA